MAVITKIEAQKRKEDRVNIYVDEKFFMAIYKELVFTFNLKKGDNIDEEYLKKILKDEMFLKGKNKALNILSKASQSEKKIREKLNEDLSEIDSNCKYMCKAEIYGGTGSLFLDGIEIVVTYESKVENQTRGIKEFDLVVYDEVKPSKYYGKKQTICLFTREDIKYISSEFDSSLEKKNNISNEDRQIAKLYHELDNIEFTEKTTMTRERIVNMIATLEDIKYKNYK